MASNKTSRTEEIVSVPRFHLLAPDTQATMSPNRPAPSPAAVGPLWAVIPPSHGKAA